jgi:hypothetical protein
MMLGRWDWLLVSIALATLASLTRWIVDRQVASGATVATQAWQLLERLLCAPWLVHTLRVIYAVGLPAAALLGHRALSATGLGLKPLPTTGTELVGVTNLSLPSWADWVSDLGTTATVAAGAWLLITLGERAARRWSTPDASRPPHSPFAALREAVIHQAHWAFYREPFIFTWGPVLGPWLGALPVLVEMLISPLFWERLHRGGGQARRAVLIRAGIFVASTLIILQTQNLWMALALDCVLGWLTAPQQ